MDFETVQDRGYVSKLGNFMYYSMVCTVWPRESRRSKVGISIEHVPKAESRVSPHQHLVYQAIHKI